MAVVRSCRSSVPRHHTSRCRRSNAVCESTPQSKLSQQKFTSVFDIRSFEAGPSKGASLPTINNLMQETGVNQVTAQYGRQGDYYATDPAMDALNLIYVLSRMRIDMKRYPRWGDIVAVDTWFAESGKTTWRRDWRLRCVDTGEELGGGSSQWVLVNTETRRIGRFTPELREKYLALSNAEEWALGVGVTAEKVATFAEGCVPLGSYTFEVPFGALDMNEHVNNCRYTEWVLESVPVEIRQTHQCESFTIEFRGECTVGTTCVSNSVEEEETNASPSSSGLRTFLHTITEEGAEERVLIRATSTWSQSSCLTSN